MEGQEEEEGRENAFILVEQSSAAKKFAVFRMRKTPVTDSVANVNNISRRLRKHVKQMSQRTVSTNKTPTKLAHEM